MTDPDRSGLTPYAWARYRRLMAWAVLLSAVVVVISLLALWRATGPLPIHMAIATLLGVSGTMILGTGLMGLVFMSAGTGHDDQIIELEDER